ncbi:MAG: hypothetical protein Kow0022_11430 [Phycisphaerales bacterium]
MTWAIFFTCALLVLDGLGFVTWQVLRLEWREAQASIESARQENERQALWRMDFFMAPLLAQESARPYFQYLPFYPAERAYTRMWEQVQPGDLLVPSPLLLSPRSQTGADLIRLYFQIDAQGRFTSPQVPTGNMLDLAESPGIGLAGRIEANEKLLSEIRAHFERASATLRANAAAQAAERPEDQPADAQARSASSDESPPDAEYQQRVRALERAAMTEDLREEARRQVQAQAEGFMRQPGSNAAANDHQHTSGPMRGSMVKVGSFRPVWVGGADGSAPELVLLRPVTIEGQVVRQGIWIDWPMLRTLLTSTILDLLPEARLVPSIDPEARDAGVSRRLASLPLVLNSGPLPEPEPLGLTWVRATLGATWIAVVAAIAAIGWVLHTSLVLSDRRGQFVSAVTHELRTPLTTFCLYTEMLCEGMVDASVRQSYLDTLRSESKRLAGIVENVLAFARLGRGRPNADGHVRVSALIDRVRDPLQRRVDQAEAELTVYVAPEAEQASVRGEAETIERVLFNLVDNACKYGRADTEPARIRLDVTAEDHRVTFRVSDQGPGIMPKERARVFMAFQRGEVQASHAQSGLGLGLALARGLAEEMGGELVLEESKKGACFALRLRKSG